MHAGPTLTPYRLTIDGLRANAVSRQTFESVNQFTGKDSARILRCGHHDRDRTVEAAHRAVSFMAPFGEFKRSGIGREKAWLIALVIAHCDAACLTLRAKATW